MGVYIPIKDYSAMQGPAPDGFHVPLNTEWQAVYDIWTALGGGSSDGTNFGIALKLPFAGNRDYSTGGLDNQGSSGMYRSSTRYNESRAYRLYFNSSAISPQVNSNRSAGFSVRCFKNSSTIPTSSWTKLYGTSIEAGGIFWSSTDGLISLSSDGDIWITIQDKNLGATTVWNSGDTLSEANAGKYYQRGNNYGFAWTGTVTTSSTQVDASAYGPGNYYSSSTFIKRSSSPYRWDTTDNANLWGGVTGAISMSELKNAYIGELLPTSVTLDKSSISLTTVGQTEQLTATVEPSDAPRKTVTWSSDNTSIATVSVSGLVTCVTPGSCNITATTVNGLTATCEVGTKWMPGVNTIFYYPLEANVNDYSGNSRNGTIVKGSLTYGTSGGIKNVALFNSTIFSIPNIAGTYGTYTFNVWCKPNSTNTRQELLDNHASKNSWTNNVYLNFNGNSSSNSVKNFGYQYRVGSASYNSFWGTTDLAINTRYNVCVVANTSSVKIYVNTTKVAELSADGTIALNNGGTLNNGGACIGGRNRSNEYNAFSGYMSEFIFENKTWTETEISKYYNSTKSLYGVS